MVAFCTSKFIRHLRPSGRTMTRLPKSLTLPALGGFGCWVPSKERIQEISDHESLMSLLKRGSKCTEMKKATEPELGRLCNGEA